MASESPHPRWLVRAAFTWIMIEEQPEKVIAMVREAIEMLAAKQS
jgi:hypothetical protein